MGDAVALDNGLELGRVGGVLGGDLVGHALLDLAVIAQLVGDAIFFAGDDGAGGEGGDLVGFFGDGADADGFGLVL